MTAQQHTPATVSEFNVGRYCLSEDECIADGIDFAAYERGIADAAAAFSKNAAPTEQSELAKVLSVLRDWQNTTDLDAEADRIEALLSPGAAK
jgi:hypothetical protein